MNLKKSVEDRIKSDFPNIKDLIHVWQKFHQDSFIKHLTPIPPRPKSLLGQNAIVFLQANLYRSHTLVNGYFDGLNRNNPLTTTLMVRAFYETAGALAYFLKKYNQFKNEIITEEKVDEELRRLYLGMRDKGELIEAPDPISVLNLIDAVDHYLKQKHNVTGENFRKNYEALSEFCHPNSFGHIYSHRIDKTNNWTVKFRSETEPYENSDFSIPDIEICMELYTEIYRELREEIEANEELPYLEYK